MNPTTGTIRLCSQERGLLGQIRSLESLSVERLDEVRNCSAKARRLPGGSSRLSLTNDGMSLAACARSFAFYF